MPDLHDEKPVIGRDLTKILVSGFVGFAVAAVMAWVAMSERVARVEERSLAIQTQLADISRKLDSVLYQERLRRSESYGAPASDGSGGGR